MPAQKPAPTTEPEVFDASALLDEIKAEGRPFALNGEQFVLPAPTTWPDEALTAANKNDLIRCAQLILGEDEYERFTKAGGTALFLQRLAEKLHGASVGESSASSSS
jgi:hypothetical protein